jgi:hypothetical protein
MKELEPLPLLLVVLAGATLILLWPLAVIWSLNTIFGTAIPMEFKTWLAVVVLVAILRVPAASPDKR